MFDTTVICDIILDVMILYYGVVPLVTGKPLRGIIRDEETYEPDSLKRSARIGGIFYTLAGVAFVLRTLENMDIIHIYPNKVVFIVIVVILIVAAIACMFLLLKKKKD